VGHRENQCFSKMCDQRDAATMALASGNTPIPTPSMNQPDHLRLMFIESCQAAAILASSNANKDLWIADTGASCHMTCNDDGMFNCVNINKTIKVGDGNFIKAIFMGNKRVSVLQPSNVIKNFVINDIRCKVCSKAAGQFV
jgi:hypothetical protein